MQPNTLFEAKTDYHGETYRCSVDTGRKVIFWQGDDVVGEAFWDEGEFRLGEEGEKWDSSEYCNFVLDELEYQIRSQIEKRVFGF